MGEIEQLVHDTAKAIYRDDHMTTLDPTWDQADSSDRKMYEGLAKAALLVALPRIGRVLEEVVYYSDPAHAIRHRLSTLEAELRSGE